MPINKIGTTGKRDETMGYVKWSYETLNHFCGDVFKAFGFTEEESNQIKDVLLTADLYGIESHGMQRMVRYHKGIEKGTIHPQAKPEVVFETPISAVIDGHNGMGQLISVYAMTILCNSLFETHFFNSFSSQTKYEINIILEKIFYFTSLSFLLKRKLPFLKKDAPYINYLISFEFFIMFIMAYYFLVNILNNMPNISNHLVFIGFLVLIIIFNIVFNKLIESNELLLKTKLKEQENKYIQENLNYIKTIKYDVDNIEHRMNYILQSIEYDLINEDYLKAIHKIKAQKETVLSISPIIVTNNETFDFILNLEIKSLLQDGKEIKTCISISENAVYNHPVAAYRITKLLKYIYNFYQHVELFIAEKEDTSLEVKFIIPHYLELSSSFEEELNTFDDYSITIIKNDETMIIQYIDSLSSYH